MLLEVLLNRTDFKIVELQTQKDLKNLYGKSICLDVWIHTNQKETINVEVQRNEEGAHPRRACYHASLMDMHATFSNGKFKEIEDMYVIFITETDVFKQDLSIYHVERTMKETKEDFNDGMHIVYVNASKQEDTAIGRLMHDFNCTNASEMYYETLRNRVQYYKEDEGGIRIMCKILMKSAKKGSSLEKNKELNKKKFKPQQTYEKKESRI